MYDQQKMKEALGQRSAFPLQLSLPIWRWQIDRSEFICILCFSLEKRNQSVLISKSDKKRVPSGVIELVTVTGSGGT
jgi:hypothetical protein